jgi:hypothetical protein
VSGTGELRAWAERLSDRYSPEIAELIGADEIPPIRVLVERQGPGAAWTNGTDVSLSHAWFAEHPDDSGCVIHELTHAIMRAPVYDATTIWLIEGLADYVRDELGHDAPWTFAHFEAGMATAGYQTTAHFLRWLQNAHPGTVKELARELSRGTYDDSVWLPLTGSSLDLCVSRYEASQQP